MTSSTRRAGGSVGAAVRIPSMWLCGFTLAEMKRSDCTYREAVVAAIECWQEQEQLEAQYMAEAANN